MANDACQKNIPPGTSLCTENHCEVFRESSTMAKWCKCKGWDGKDLPDCKPQGGSFPVEAGECYNRATGERIYKITMDGCLQKRDSDRDWSWRACYCCCSCFAWGTRITVAPGAYRVVESIGLEDPVLTTRVRVVNGKPVLDWISRPVTFSDGMEPADNQTAVLLQYGEQGELVVTPDQPMLMADGALKTADRITLDDYLVDYHGDPVKVTAVVLGRYRVGFHAISAQQFENQEEAGWFLEANGVVAGDHMVMAMQDADTIAAMFVDSHDELPKIGTDDYAASARNTVSASAALSEGAHEIVSLHFTPLDELLALQSPVPFGATPYITQKQARDIALNGTFRGLTETFLVNEFKYFASLFKAFYPRVNFYLNWEDLNPNAFAFNAYGQDTVYVSGQLLRLNGMFKQGLAMIMAHGAARFLPSETTNDSGLLCTGPADYSGANQILQTLFYGDYMSWAMEGYQQIKRMFSLIDPENLPGYEMCSTPSIPCRLETINAAVSGLPLPACAGGPVPGALRLESAVWTDYEQALAIKVDFNLRLRTSTASNPLNYRLTDEQNTAITIGLVQLDARDRSVAWLIIDGGEPEQELTLTVRDILADNGSTLDPEATSTTVQ
ncbi:hypothetical protein DWU98_04680 [Dyella monticola]|uniref:Hint domain-containing protein n=1 Tax=Dyella monticola TaxID=1927958 RepID=A0A370X5S2_9GAMM|nr:hypothetical protein [Dyella monticola]RDS83630.1 hypothetical protein DWU98_04680 [Dyella monticola]